MDTVAVAMSHSKASILSRRIPGTAGIRSHRGFSLLEVILVLGLIGLLAGLAWPSVAALQQRQGLDQACRDVTSVVQTARRLALQSQAAVRVEVNRQGTSTTVWVTVGPEVVQKQLPSGVRFPANQSEVLWTCHRDGRIEGGTIRLQDESGQAVWIDCHPLSGTVSIQRQPGGRS